MRSLIVWPTHRSWTHPEHVLVIADGVDRDGLARLARRGWGGSGVPARAVAGSGPRSRSLRCLSAAARRPDPPRGEAVGWVCNDVPGWIGVRLTNAAGRVWFPVVKVPVTTVASSSGPTRAASSRTVHDDAPHSSPAANENGQPGIVLRAPSQRHTV
jgi:hypothetical protein